MVRRSWKVAAAVAVALNIGVAAAAVAHAGPMDHGMAPRGMHGRSASPMAAPHAPASEPQGALQEQMRDAKTPEERRKLMMEHHAQSRQRSNEEGSPSHGQHAPCASGTGEREKHAH